MHYVARRGWCNDTFLQAPVFAVLLRLLPPPGHAGRDSRPGGQRGLHGAGLGAGGKDAGEEDSRR